MPGILIFFHCESNPGYAAAKHEVTFFDMAMRLVGSPQNIHFAYPTTKNGRSPTLPKELTNIVEFDASSRHHSHLRRVEDYIRRHDIHVAFGFDQPIRRPSHKYIRRGGVRYLISYWGAPMSSINHGFKLALKKVDVALARHRPDHFIFQSEGMRETATRGRGVPADCTSVVRSGVDTRIFAPADRKSYYAHDTFGIPRDRKIVFFSGHMEGRKGVEVIIRTACHLVGPLRRSDVHFLIVGNKGQQERTFLSICNGSPALGHITFGGYRDDIPNILKSSSIGHIPSTEWDSFPMSSIEMAATGLPLVVSDIPGLRESVTEKTGLLYPPGDYIGAADRLCKLLDDDSLRQRMGMQGRQRVVREFSIEHQITGMENVVRQVCGPILARQSGRISTAA